MGCNPGGEVKGVRLPHQVASELRPYEVDRLYSMAEIEALGPAARF